MELRIGTAETCLQNPKGVTMEIWILLVLIFVAGAIGGTANAFLSKDGVVLPRRVETDHGLFLQPGVIGNLVVGAVAAVVSWGLYGPLNSAPVDSKVSMTVSSLVGAILMGMGG